MQHNEAFTVLLSCSLLMFYVTHGVLTDFSEELHNTKGLTLQLLNHLFNQSYYTEADYLQAWINLQYSLKRQTFLNSRSRDLKHAAVYGVNQFSVFSTQQFKDLYLRAHPDKVPRYRFFQHGRLGASNYPRKFDWRDHGAVGPVYNQKSCGACWAFSVVSAVESVRVKDGGKFQELSVQQVIDCAYKSQGCDGGSTVSTLHWLKQSGEKLVNETEYPYKAETGVCQIFPRSDGGVSVKDYAAFDFSGQEEEMSRRLVDWGPLVVIVDAVSWQDYQGGIIQHHCSPGHANHAVLITGYDTTGEVPFWIVRNSWGTAWGDEGYVYVKMGENMCGVADSVAAVFL
ncbi:cathepsin O [Pangasianodon hypophthalmus]|uniref:cathepsin O n=1 Tax=Pangasianodon hypophthalmus TaxID=310915 RepID=UPI002307DF3F|nr:cathepsin O [Pangasianodon hypophthalmus]